MLIPLRRPGPSELATGLARFFRLEVTRPIADDSSKPMLISSPPEDESPELHPGCDCTSPPACTREST